MARGIIIRGRSNSMPNVVVPTLARGIERRRNGLGNIFKGQKSVERGDKMLKRSFSVCTDKTKKRGQSVRPTFIVGDFEMGTVTNETCNYYEGSESSLEWRNEINRDYPDVTEREINLDMLVSGLHQIGERRLALADIFEKVENECLLELLALYSRFNVSLPGDHRLESRRNGLGYVYENINEEDLKMFLIGYEGDVINSHDVDVDVDDSSSETSDEEEQVVNYVRNRRNALGNIYDGVEPENVQTLADAVEIEEEAKHFNFASRRMGLTSNEDILSISDRLRSEESENEEDLDDTVQCRSRSRRTALGNIFSDLESDEISSFLRRFRNEKNVSDCSTE